LYPGDWQNKPSQGEAFRNIKVAMVCCHGQWHVKYLASVTTQC